MAWLRDRLGDRPGASRKSVASVVHCRSLSQRLLEGTRSGDFVERDSAGLLPQQSIVLGLRRSMIFTRNAKV